MQEILELIQTRQSARTPFDPERPVAKQDLRQILEAGRWSPTAHNMQNFEIIVVDDKKLLETVGNLKYPVSEAFIRENYAHLSFSEEELLRKKVGILGAMFPPAWRTPGAKLDDADKVNSSLGRLIQTSLVLLIIVYDPRNKAPASEGDFLGIISLGCATENMWLMAQSLGIGFHIVSSLASDPVAKEIKHILNIPESLKIVYAIRLGYPSAPPAKALRVRREVADFTHYNRFGRKGLD